MRQGGAAPLDRLPKFQSTHPLRGGTGMVAKLVAQYIISIHAPLAGCDVRSLCRRHAKLAISIHAPLAGCDSTTIRRSRRLSRFQSTHPLRGATREQIILYMACGHFNPRTPCGVRPVGAALNGKTLRISIHAPLAGCDGESMICANALTISIHAPLAGCDFWAERSNE